MKYLKTYLLLGLSLLCSCTRATDEEQIPQMQTRICLNFDSGDSSTRAALNSGEADYRHITTVYLFLFEGSTPDAPCILKENIGWKAGNVAQKYWISHSLKPGISYSYLAVGWDEGSGEVYSLPEGLTEGMTLGQARARLHVEEPPVGTTPQQAARVLKDKMARAEIFTGQDIRSVMPGQLHVEVNLVLRRKVAGIIAYLRSIPYKVDNEVVDHVEVRLHTAQNTAFGLWNADPQMTYFGSSPLSGDDRVLFRWDMSAYTNDGDIYTSPARVNDRGEEIQLPNTLLSGAYLLPVEHSAQPTLSIVLCNALGRELKTYDVLNKNQIQFDLRENCLYNMGTKLTSGSTEGDRPADLSGKAIDVEVSAWNEVVSNQDFESIQGAARILSNISPENYIFDAPGTTFDIFIKKGTPQERWTLSVVYDPYTDAAGVLQPTGNAAFANAAHDDLRDWIHIADVDAEGNISALANSKVQADGNSRVVRIVLNDYAIQRNLTDGISGPDAPNSEQISNRALAEKFGRDYRTAYLKIETQGSPSPLYYRIRQYNALTIHTTFTGDADHNDIFNPDPNPYRAAARLDFGWKFNEQTGIAEEETPGASPVEWGFRGSVTNSYTNFNTTISQAHMSVDDGEMNLKAIMRKCEGTNNHDLQSGYSGCAVKRTACPRINVRTDASSQQVRETNTGDYLQKRYWYLPAQNEMSGITKNFDPATSTQEAIYTLYAMTPGQHYWTSTDHKVDFRSAMYLTATHNADPQSADKKDLKRVRRVRHF